MGKFKLKEADKTKISEAVKKAESKTSGEIATAFVKESYDYAIYELIFAVIISFFYFVIMMFFTSNIENWLQSRFWDYTPHYLVAFYGFSTFLIGTIFYFLANISVIDRIIVPKKILKQKVQERALRHFVESGVYNTRDRTGILIFISLMEHQVILLADSGIDEKIEQKQWQQMVDHIIAGIKSGKIADHLCKSITDCGILLEQYFPIKEDDTNELANEIEELEK